MNSPLYLLKTPCRGGIVDSGEVFDDPLPVKDLSTATINRIVIRSGTLIDSIEVFYSWNNGRGIVHGGGGGGGHELTLEPDEFITKIEGRATHKVISRLTFVTNKRIFGPYGGTEGEGFTWGEVGGTRHSESRMRLLAINGYAGRLVYMLQATFAEYRPHEHTLRTVRYESATAPKTPTHTDTSLIPSKFASHIMAPIVTLIVGKDMVELHVHEDTLCQLPFFKAALQGQFKEASQRTIEMPEDHQGYVSALVEYLYTGKYTYTYDPQRVYFPGESGVPVGSLAEGLFHVGVYVVATKYICPGLVEIAVRNFEAVLSDLDNIDTLRLWKAAYAEGIYLPGRRIDYKQYRSCEQFIPWIRGLLNEHREEMENTISKYPGLAYDLLRIATGNSSG